MSQAPRDENRIATLLGTSNADGTTPVAIYADPTTHRLLVDLPGGSGTVTDVSVVSANGFAGSVANSTTTPAITLSTTVTGILKGNGTAISAAVAGTDYTSLAFKTISVSGQSDIVADTPEDTLTIAAGAGITITTNAGTDTLTIASSITGTVTSVSFTGGLISVADATTTPALTVAGTSGGIPYFSSASTWATSAALGANSIVIGGGAGVAPATTATGTGVITALGVNIGSAGAVVVFDGALGTPSSGTVTNLTGTASININGTVGATTPTTGVFTTVVAGSTTSLLLGTAGSAVGNIGFRNATSGTITLAPVTGALGTVTLTLPARTDTLVTLGGTETLTAKTLTSPIINGATLSGTLTMAESTSLALDPAQADATWTGITRAGTAGATLAFGEVCYLAAADSRWELADADGATTSDRMLGMCVLAAAADGDPTVMLLMGNIQAASKFPAMTIGSAMYVGETPGAIQVAIPTGADNVIRRVGYALTADELYFNPSMDSQITVA